MPTKWLTVVTAAILFTALTLASVQVANADPKNNPAATYSKCVGDALVDRGQDVNTTTAQFQAAAFDCCTIQGLQWVGNYPAGYCEVPNTSYDPGNTPPTGATVIRPPGGEQTELNPAPPPPPTVVLPPGQRQTVQ